jgi:hypothetical protein
MFVEPKYRDPVLELSSYDSLDPIYLEICPNDSGNAQAYVSRVQVEDEYSDIETQTNEILLSDRRKFLFTYHPAFFHSTIDSYGLLTTVLNKYGKDLHVVLIDKRGTQTKFITDYLDLEGVSYDVYGDQTVLKINNYFTATFIYPTLDTLNLTEEMLVKSVPVSDEEPYRKVILSRAKVPYNARGEYKLTDDEKLRIEPAFRNQMRIDDESALAEFFKENSFEVVYPEDFTSVKEQIEFMRTVKVLVSLSGSGLTNQVFMKPGQTVIELTNAVANYDVVSVGVIKEFHNQYLTLSLAKKHTYISVPHERSFLEVKSKFESNEMLKRLLDG